MSGSDLYLTGEGKWEPIDVFAGAGDNIAVDEELRARGWRDFCCVGDFNNGGLYIQTWRRPHPEDRGFQYLLLVGNAHTEVAEGLVVDGLPAALNLLAKWAPAVQAQAITGVIAETVNSPIEAFGFVEQIGARLAYGMNDGRAETLRQDRLNTSRH